MKEKILPILALHAATFFWACNAIIGKWLIMYIKPIPLATIRYSIATILFGILFHKIIWKERNIKSDIKMIFIIGLLSVFLFSTSLYTSLEYTTAINTNIILGLIPILSVFINKIISKEEVRFIQIIAWLLGFFGLIILVFKGSIDSLLKFHFNLGDIICVFAAIVWSTYTVLIKKIASNRSTITNTAFSILLVLPLLWIASIDQFSEKILYIRDYKVIMGVLFVGIFPSIVSLASWNYGVKKIGANAASNYINFISIYGISLSILFLGEEIFIYHIVGFFLVIVGSLLSSINLTKKLPSFNSIL